MIVSTPHFFEHIYSDFFNDYLPCGRSNTAFDKCDRRRVETLEKNI